MKNIFIFFFCIHDQQVIYIYKHEVKNYSKSKQGLFSTKSFKYLKNLNGKKLNCWLIIEKIFYKKTKLPDKIFKGSSVLDLGCGSGQNTIIYDYCGAECTLVEYDRKSFFNAKSLFKRFSKNNLKFTTKIYLNLN